MTAVSPDLLVVGGGPAGMSAAIAAAEHGVSSVLLDESFELGGQIYRPPVSSHPDAKPAVRGNQLRAQMKQHSARIDVQHETSVFGIYPSLEVTATRNDQVERFRPKKLVLAPGAYEFVPPFPGWTLPGVMTPGAAQILAKSMGVAIEGSVLLAGTGPFLLAVACQLLEAGVDVRGVLETSRRRAWHALPLHGWRTPGILRDGMRYLARLRRASVPVHYGKMVTAVHGNGRVQSVTHAPVDRDWNPDRTKARTEDIDTLCVGYGFVPRVYLAQLAGCELEMREETGGWIPRRDENLATTIEGVFSAGDGAGVAGALVAELEGRLAGLVAAAQLGAMDANTLARQRRPVDRSLAKLAPLRRALDAISRPRQGLESLVEDDTLVCRCEEIPWRDVRGAIEHGGTRFRSLKVMTRLGMGACQGRFCWPAASRQVACKEKCSLAQVGPTSPRPPIRPVRLGALAPFHEESR